MSYLAKVQGYVEGLRTNFEPTTSDTQLIHQVLSDVIVYIQIQRKRESEEQA